MTMNNVMRVVHLGIAGGSHNWYCRVLRALAEGATLKLENPVGALDWHGCSW